MILSLAWKNIWRNKLRSAIVISSMVFGLMGVMMMIGFSNAMVDNMVDNAIAYEYGHLQVHNPEFIISEDRMAWLPEADLLGNKIKSVRGVAGVTVRQVIDGMVGSAATTRGVRINGIDGNAEATVTSLAAALVEGTLFPDPGRNPILISQRNAEKLKIRLGSKVVLTFSDKNGDVTGAAFRVCGLFRTPSSGYDDGTVFVRKTDLAPLIGFDHAHEIAVRLDEGQSLDETKGEMKAIVGTGGVVRDWKEVQPVLAAMISGMGVVNAVLMAIFVVAMGFGIVNIMLMSVYERTREFGMLMAIGMEKRRIVQLISMESILLGGVGSLCGMAASVLLIGVTGRVGLPFGAMAEGLGGFGVDTVLFPTVRLTDYFIFALFILLTSFLASIYPTRLIMKVPPHEAMVKKH